MMSTNHHRPTEREYYMFTLRIMGDFGIVIAVPVVIFVLIGDHLDDLYGTNPLYKLIGFAIAAVLSGIIVRRKTYRYNREFRALNQDKSNPDDEDSLFLEEIESAKDQDISRYMNI